MLSWTFVSEVAYDPCVVAGLVRPLQLSTTAPFASLVTVFPETSASGALLR